MVELSIRRVTIHFANEEDRNRLEAGQMWLDSRDLVRKYSDLPQEQIVDLLRIMAHQYTDVPRDLIREVIKTEADTIRTLQEKGVDIRPDYINLVNRTAGLLKEAKLLGEE